MPVQKIQLQSQFTDHFPSYIAGNAIDWQTMALVELQELMPPDEYEGIVEDFNTIKVGFVCAESVRFKKAIETYLKNRYVVGENAAEGQHLVLCGAGPTLAEHAAEWCPQGDQVWGCNSALTWLLNNGHKATHGFAVDQTPHMCVEWASTPDVQYLLASTVNPNLVSLLRSRERSIQYFHNYVGIQRPPVTYRDENGMLGSMDYETFSYVTGYPPTLMAGAGLNAVTRALDVANYMGFAKITVLGADCSLRVKGKHMNKLTPGSAKHLKWLRECTVMHADGGHALASDATPTTLSAKIDSGTVDTTVRPGKGRWWTTKPDMVLSAQWLLRLARASGGRIQLIGDGLPNALAMKNEAYLRALPNFCDATGNVVMMPGTEDLAG